MGSLDQRSGFRQYIPSQDTERSKQLSCSNTYEWAQHRCKDDFMRGWIAHWENLASQPYKGITTDSDIVPNLFHLDSAGTAPDAHDEMVSAASTLLATVSSKERQHLVKDINAREWRYWGNPEIYVYRHGIRLEEVSEEAVQSVYDLLRASLSPAGYEKARGCMRVNQFLGEVVNGRQVLNERSYNFCMFGLPSETEPWGWQIFGHHFCMNCLRIGKQMIISPVFMGAEPNIIDDGPFKGTQLFIDQEKMAMTMMRSMDNATIDRVRIFKELTGPEYPPGRFHRADQRHLGGIFQDNRVIPYEGLKVSSLSPQQQATIRELLILSLNYLPDWALTSRMQEITAHWNNTHFAWIGEFGDEDAFYYKIHSPVVMVEFDHHSGVFLNNKVALPFHIHTIVRTPNGNDYGKALLEQYQTRHVDGSGRLGRGE